MEELYLFSAGSANDNTHKHLWIKGASLFIPQMNELLFHTDYKFEIIDIYSFENDAIKLAEILNNNRSDKSNPNNYHILYSYIFNKLGGPSTNLNILEIGLGTNNPSLVSTMGSNARPGASIYAFKEYLPNSNIYGCDIDKDILFQEDRIKTCYVDQLDFKTFYEIPSSFGSIKFDLIIDDGLHSIGANFNTILFALKNLNEKGWIVVEDIQIISNWKSIDYILKTTNKFKTYIVKTNSSAYLYVINKL